MRGKPILMYCKPFEIHFFYNVYANAMDACFPLPDQPFVRGGGGSARRASSDIPKKNRFFSQNMSTPSPAAPASSSVPPGASSFPPPSHSVHSFGPGSLGLSLKRVSSGGGLSSPLLFVPSYAYVFSVKEGSYGAREGIRAGDCLVSVQGRRFDRNIKDIEDRLSEDVNNVNKDGVIVDETQQILDSSWTQVEHDNVGYDELMAAIKEVDRDQNQVRKRENQESVPRNETCATSGANR